MIVDKIQSNLGLKYSYYHYLKMQIQKAPSGSKDKFHKFVDEVSSDEAADVEWKWKKEAERRRSKAYNIILFGTIIVIAIIFYFLVRALTSLQVMKHFELDYNDQRYRYIQSQQPHLKYLILSDTPTVQTKLIKSTGALYPELMAWIQSSLQPNAKVLLVPNENSGQAVLTIALGFYLKKSQGGVLRVLIQNKSYREQVQKNIAQMKIQHGTDRFPIEIIIKCEQPFDQYGLLVIQNNNFHKKLSTINRINLIIIRKEGTSNTIIPQFQYTHDIYEITDGKVGGNIGFTNWFNYGIVPYQLTDVAENNIMFLVARIVASDWPYCQERNPKFIDKEEDRNLVQFLRNRTFANASLYFQLNNLQIANSLSMFPTVSSIYVTLQQKASTTNQKLKMVAQRSQMAQSSENYYFLLPENIKSISKSRIITKISSQSQADSLMQSFKGDKLIKISPFSNKGCYFPAKTSPFDGMPSPKPYYVLIESTGK